MLVMISLMIPHTGLLIVCILLLVLTLSYFLLASLMFLDPKADPSGRKNLMCQPHGRISAAIVVVQFTAGLVYSLGMASPWAQAFIQAVLGLSWLALLYWFLPFWNLELNKFQAAGVCVFIASAGCSALNLGLQGGVGMANAAAIAWVALLPLAVFFGISIIGIRYRSFAHATELSSPYLVQVLFCLCLYVLILRNI